MHDEGQPFSCTQWGDAGPSGIPFIASENIEVGTISFYLKGSISYPYGLLFNHEGALLTHAVGRVNCSHEYLDNIPLQPCCPSPGDLNDDGDHTVEDVVILIDYILSEDPSAEELEYVCAADMTNDGVYDVLDVIFLLNYILT
jgi:hypothetical protein